MNNAFEVTCRNSKFSASLNQIGANAQSSSPSPAAKLAGVKSGSMNSNVSVTADSTGTLAAGGRTDPRLAAIAPDFPVISSNAASAAA